MDSILQSGRGGGLMRETKLPMQKLELKMQGAYARRGDVMAGFYGIFRITMSQLPLLTKYNIEHLT